MHGAVRFIGGGATLRIPTGGSRLAILADGSNPVVVLAP